MSHINRKFLSLGQLWLLLQCYSGLPGREIHLKITFSVSYYYFSLGTGLNLHNTSKERNKNRMKKKTEAGIIFGLALVLESHAYEPSDAPQ
jgi:hypothetical protein